MAGAAAAGAVQAAAQGLRYRDFLTISLIIDGEDLFPDNWIYIHEPGVAGRPHPELPLLVARGWSRTSPRRRSAWSTSASRATSSGRSGDEDLVELGKREIEQLGLAKAANVERGFVTRVPKAYPMYDADYGERVDVIRDWLEGIGNLQQVGRNGLHRYNNSDHSMLTAMRAVENVTTGTNHDMWAVNAESAYHEEHQEPEQPYRRVPRPSTSASRFTGAEEAACVRVMTDWPISGELAF